MSEILCLSLRQSVFLRSMTEEILVFSLISGGYYNEMYLVYYLEVKILEN